MILINRFIKLSFVVSVITLTACNDKLDIVPPSNVTPEDYLWEESQLEAYTVNRYGAIPIQDAASGPFASDNATDIQAGMGVPNKYTKGEWKVPATGGDWDWGELYNINYFLNLVVPRHANGEISGNQEMINHYIGEMYFFRALQHYNKLVAIGDAPIVKTTYPDDKEILIEASKRMPRTEVARFIISDLDSAIMLMKPQSPDGKRNRLYKSVAQLFKSRVALYEGTWLKYFKGTAFVPNGPGWPGAEKEYNKGYQFQAGSIDEEINWFLDQAIEAADQVASQFTLTQNTGILPQGPGESNPFVEMYGVPKYNDVDPTLLVAISYTLLFGIMFGDLGQGIILSIVGLIAERKFKLRLGGVGVRLGISSAIFGLFFGSVFGNEEFLAENFKGISFFNAMSSENTMTLLLAAIGLGVVLILVSMVFNTILNMKKKNMCEAILSQNGLCGVIFYLAVLGVALNVMMAMHFVNMIYIAVLIVLPLVMIFLKEPLTRKIVEHESMFPNGFGAFFVEGFFELFEVVLSFITNTMSFLRVGGFVLSHAGMMLVVYTLAEMIGGIGQVIVLILGNAFVMCLEGLIVGIQVLRLEFYEMFSRYYEGNGIPFKTIKEE